MPDKTHNQQAYQLIEDGAIAVVKNEGNAFEGYLKLAAGLSRLSAKFSTTQKVTAELRRIIENAQMKGKSFRNDHENLLVGIPNNPADSKRASALRKALIWMHEQPKQLAFIRERHPQGSAPASLHAYWKRHQSSCIKEALENGDNQIALADNLEGVTQKEAKAMLKKASEAKAKSEAKAPKPKLVDIHKVTTEELLAEAMTRSDIRDHLSAILAEMKGEPQAAAPVEETAAPVEEWDKEADYVCFLRVKDDDAKLHLTGFGDLEPSDRKKAVQHKLYQNIDGEHYFNLPKGTKIMDHCRYDEDEGRPISIDYYERLRVPKWVTEADGYVMHASEHFENHEPTKADINAALKFFNIKTAKVLL